VEAIGEQERRGERRRAAELRLRQASHELDQRQRVSFQLRDQTCADLMRERGRGRQAKQLDRGSRRQPWHLERGETRQWRAVRDRESRGEEHENALGIQSACGETEHLGRRVVEHVGVVDDAHHGSLRRSVRQKHQDREADDEPVRGLTAGTPERRFQRLPLRLGQLFDAIQQRHEQLMQSGELQLELRLDAADAQELRARRAARGIVEQACLADPGRAAEDDHPALTGTRARDERLKLPALVDSVDEREELGDRHLKIVSRRAISPPRVDDALVRPAAPTRGRARSTATPRPSRRCGELR